MIRRDILKLATEQNIDSIANVEKLKGLCNRVYLNCNIDLINELRVHISKCSATICQSQQVLIITVLYPCLKNFQKSSKEFSPKERHAAIDLFTEIFKKIIISSVSIFFNFYGVLLYELHGKDAKDYQISEEYKLSIIECMIALAKCVDDNQIPSLYSAEYVPRLSQMIFAAIKLAKNEQYKALRITAINCVMALARVLEDDHFGDIVLRDTISKVFVYYLPGITTQLKVIALIDEKYGHKIPMTAVRAWGRIVTLVMQDYRSSDERVSHITNVKTKSLDTPQLWQEAVKDYLQKANNLPEWYSSTDIKLKPIISQLSKLTFHSHRLVRQELATIAVLIIENCLYTMPKSVCELVKVLITLTGDTEDKIVKMCQKALENLRLKLKTDEMNVLLEYLEDDFYKTITSIPRKFNGIDEGEKLASLSLLLGYINLFGEYRLKEVLQSHEFIKGLISTLLYICELDKTGISVLEEYAIKDFNDQISPTWKNFRYFTDFAISNKITTICLNLSKFGVGPIIVDFLLDTISTDLDYKKEGLFLLNQIILGLEETPENSLLIKTIVSTYIDRWYLPLTVITEEDGTKHTLGAVQNNIIEACLLCEGIGALATITKTKFSRYLLNIYLVVERAGSGHPLIRSAGTMALSQIVQACGYSSIEDLLNKNIDYISFHLERKLNRVEQSEGALSVLSVILQYSTMEGLDSKASIISKLLEQISEVRKNDFILNSYLKVFKMFIICLHKWLNISLEQSSIKTRKEKEENIEDFTVSGIDNNANNFSDDIMDGKSAEELYKEDLAKSQKELEEENEPETVPEYKKPEPPLVIKLTVEILQGTHHFLPSKNVARKLLVLEILKNGIEILKDWENELLPIVHKIWLTLVDRFQEFDSPMIVNYSCQLLAVLAKLSKDFIRSRTVKEVLPNLIKILETTAKKSLLKDRGSAYRYSQDYKLQLCILEKLPRIITDLDMLQNDINKIMDCVFFYISDKQPLPLQNLALEFFKVLLHYDFEPTKNKLNLLLEKNLENSEYSTNRLELLKVLK